MATAEQIFERFASKVEFRGECWEWKGAKPIKGHDYGQMRDETQMRVQAHRFAYEFFVGPIPDGLHIDHLCRNEWCVNPRHLEPVTAQENFLRGIGPIPCKHGKRAQIHCKECAAEHRYAYYLSRKRVNRTNERIKFPCITIGVHAPIPLVKDLDSAVAATGLNRSAIIRRALSDYLASARKASA